MDKATIITDKSDAARLVANAEVLAHTLNLSRRRVYQLIDEGVLEKVGARFSFVKSVQNYIDFIRPDNQVEVALDEQLKIEQTRLTKARADKAQIEVELAEGKVAPLEDMKDAWKALAIEVRTRLLNIPHRATMRLVGENSEAAIKAILKDEVRNALISLVEDYAPKEPSNE